MFLVTSGHYDDYAVRGIFDTEDEAVSFAELLRRDFWAEAIRVKDVSGTLYDNPKFGEAVEMAENNRFAYRVLVVNGEVCDVEEIPYAEAEYIPAKHGGSYCVYATSAHDAEIQVLSKLEAE